MSIRQTKESHTYVSHSQNTFYFAKKSNFSSNFWHNSIKFFWHFYYWDVDQSINVGIIFFPVGFFFLLTSNFLKYFTKKISCIWNLGVIIWSMFTLVGKSWVLSDTRIQNLWRRPFVGACFCGCFSGVFFTCSFSLFLAVKAYLFSI